MSIELMILTVFAFWLVGGIFSFLLVDPKRKPPRVMAFFLLIIIPIQWLAEALEYSYHWLFSYRD